MPEKSAISPHVTAFLVLVIPTLPKFTARIKIEVSEEQPTTQLKRHNKEKEPYSIMV